MNSLNILFQSNVIKLFIATFGVLFVTLTRLVLNRFLLDDDDFLVIHSIIIYNIITCLFTLIYCIFHHKLIKYGWFMIITISEVGYVLNRLFLFFDIYKVFYVIYYNYNILTIYSITSITWNPIIQINICVFYTLASRGYVNLMEYLCIEERILITESKRMKLLSSQLYNTINESSAAA